MVLIGLSTCMITAAQLDSDRDGLTDDFEQQLLEMFRPRFVISASDCAGLPAKIKPGQLEPEVVSIDGTIYGQVFPSALSKDLIEIHYYTLWSRDCGRMSHPFDVEHVSSLVRAESHPKAMYWYAGAHEGTVCEKSSGARAASIDGSSNGPKVWSSSGKHALYLRKEMCGGGCGADSCSDDLELDRNRPVINIGELNAPANESLWTNSPAWILSDKMDTDFSTGIVGFLDESPNDSVTTLRGRGAVRGAIQGSASVLDGADSAASNTGAALDTANHRTSSGLANATRATGRSLKRAWKAVFSPKSKNAR